MSSAIRLMLRILSVRDKERVKEKTKETLVLMTSTCWFSLTAIDKQREKFMKTLITSGEMLGLTHKRSNQPFCLFYWNKVHFMVFADCRESVVRVGSWWEPRAVEVCTGVSVEARQSKCVWMRSKQMERVSGPVSTNHLLPWFKGKEWDGVIAQKVVFYFIVTPGSVVSVSVMEWKLKFRCIISFSSILPP